MDQDRKTKIFQLLEKIGQSHLYENFDKFPEAEQNEFLNQVELLEKSYPGGLETYVQRAKQLLQDSLNDVNPYEGYEPQIPNGQYVDFNNINEIEGLEQIGLELIKDTCFVLVAGGLGERLGFDGIKVSIPIETVTYTSFMKYYCEYLLAFQQYSGASEIPLAIMTSGDTDEKTKQYLEENNYFGLNKAQITIMKQEKIPAMLDNDARFAQEPDSLLIQCKPHGHGDVHQLLYMTGLVKKWAENGKKYLIFFQDTNAQVFRSYPSVLGVSKKFNLEMNSICIPRKPGEAVGAIVNLQSNDKSKQSMTINVEYNQIGALFKGSQEPTDNRGYSLYPGNINSLVLSIPEYNAVLQEQGGCIAEFINPKYTDKTKTTFKSPTRLECMMQDYPKLLKSGDRVGITQIDRIFCFSTCKNDLKTAQQKFKDNLLMECAGSCEADYYKLNQKILQLAGVEIEEPTDATKQVFEGIEINFGPRIILKPSFGVTLKSIKDKFKGTNKISAQSTIILEGLNTQVENFNLDGSFSVNHSIKDLTFLKQNYLELVGVNINDYSVKNYLRIRGYDTVNQQTIEID